MDRRQFFKLGFSRVRDSARKRAPEIIRKEMRATTLDVTILTSRPEQTEAMVDELLREHFGERMLRLRQSKLEGEFPGGIVLFEDTARRDFHDGTSLFYAALRQMETDLLLTEEQRDPTLLRYSSETPPFSRSIEVFCGGNFVRSIVLSEEGEYEVEGALGAMILAVEAGRLRVRHAPCTHQTCTAHPPIITPGQRITCVPSDISIVVGAVLKE